MMQQCEAQWNPGRIQQEQTGTILNGSPRNEEMAGPTVFFTPRLHCCQVAPLSSGGPSHCCQVTPLSSGGPPHCCQVAPLLSGGPPHCCQVARPTVVRWPAPLLSGGPTVVRWPAPLLSGGPPHCCRWPLPCKTNERPLVFHPSQQGQPQHT